MPRREVAAFVGLPTAHFIAALGAALAIPLTWRWKRQTGAGVDLTPSMHWPAHFPSTVTTFSKSGSLAMFAAMPKWSTALTG